MELGGVGMAETGPPSRGMGMLTVADRFAKATAMLDTGLEAATVAMVTVWMGWSRDGTAGAADPMTQGRHCLTEDSSGQDEFDSKTAAAVLRILYGERRAVAAMSVLLGATCSEVACLSVPNDRRCDLRARIDGLRTTTGWRPDDQGDRG